jgi:ADP-ribose pyrophosphatase
MSALPPYPGVVIESDRTVWEGRFRLQLIHFRHRRFDGTMSGERIWELWRRGRAAAMLPYDPWSDRVVLMEQFRLPALAAGVDPVMVEIPAGLCEDGEQPEQTIAREMREEIGLDADRTETIGDFVLTPGGCDERCSLYVGRIRAPEAHADGTVGLAGLAAEQEDIRVRLLPAEQAIDAAIAAAYPNSVTALALLWLGHRRSWLRARWKDQ